MTEICVDARMVGYSGIGRYLTMALRGLVPFKKKLLLLVRRGAEKVYPWLEEFPRRIADFPIYSVEEQLRLPLLIPRCRVFWSPHFNVPLMRIAAERRIVTIHDVYHLAFASALPMPQRLYAKMVIRRAAHMADRITTVSEFSRQEIVRYTGVDIQKIDVIPSGYDSEWLGESVSSISLPEKFILFVGNLKPHKNLQRLVRAMEKIEEWSLVIVGRGEESIEESTQVRVLRTVADRDLAQLYRRSSAVVLPSLYEGFGLPPIEAMRCGVPIVVSNIASLPEVCGDAAEYVDPYDEADICRGIVRVLTDAKRRDELILKGKERSNLFSSDKVAVSYRELFSDYLKE
jgi:glycosyltransferase involved in cell wall biosynthesis